MERSDREHDGVVVPTHNAILRYQERVEALAFPAAERRIRELAAHSAVRSRPRWWTMTEHSEGALFFYPSAAPGVCLVVRDGLVVTVLERSLRWTRTTRELSATRRRRPPYHRPAPGARLFDVEAA